MATIHLLLIIIGFPIVELFMITCIEYYQAVYQQEQLQAAGRWSMPALMARQTRLHNEIVRYIISLIILLIIYCCSL